MDLIIGGHSHTYLEHEVEENGVIIAQAGTGTDQIGRFDIIVDTDNNCIDSYTWRTVPICAETCPRNPAMEQVLHRFTSQVDEKYSHIVGRFRRELTHPQRTRETELGNLFADIFTRSLALMSCSSAPAASGPKSWAPLSPTATSSRASPTTTACSCSR